MDHKLPEAELTAIRESLFKGHKIQAIKVYREATRCQLIEAKQAVEKIEAELRLSSPAKFVEIKGLKGCLSLVAMFAVVLVLSVVWVMLR